MEVKLSEDDERRELRRRRDCLIEALADWHELSESELIIYAAIFEAARLGEVCPTGEQLNELTGYSSDSASRKQMKRLEAKGLIEADRGSRFRRVKVTATGQVTARAPNDHSMNRQWPRGSVDPSPFVGAIDALDDNEMLALTSIGEFDPVSIFGDVVSIARFERKLNRVMELLMRRKNYLLAGCVDREDYKRGRL